MDLQNSTQIKKIVILGLPNTGKSQVFNNLTGKYAVVANYPLTTVEVKRAKCRIDGQCYEVIDTPGLHCLYIHSEEELIVRVLIFKDSPDIIIQCIDANQLKQSLTLTADMLDLEIPMVISLNAVDETAKKGLWIDSAGNYIKAMEQDGALGELSEFEFDDVVKENIRKVCEAASLKEIAKIALLVSRMKKAPEDQKEAIKSDLKKIGENLISRVEADSGPLNLPQNIHNLFSNL